MKAVITGSEGFVGQYLKQHLESMGVEVIGFNLRDGEDLRIFEQVRNFLDIHRPTHIFHLAAQAFVAESFSNPQRTFEVNTLGSINILEAVRQLGLKVNIQLAGTSEEYGDGEVSEDAMLQPKSPYAVSKVAMDYMGQLYARSYDMHVVVTRSFNHTGPGRGEMYAESSFAKQIVEIELKRRKILEHGNLTTSRNYTDVRDVVRAYVSAIDLPSGIYNICSRQNVTIQKVLDMLIDLSPASIPTSQNRSLLRPADFSFKEPSAEKFQHLVDHDWEPEIKLEQTLEDILNYWRQELKS